MAEAMGGGYFPVYPHDGALPDPELRTFFSNFYRTSDRPEADELWVSLFTPDARVTIGADAGCGEDEIRALRKRMWARVRRRQHTVSKVFPGRFDGGCEAMLMGEVRLTAREDGAEAVLPWAAHAVLRWAEAARDWRIAEYRVWLQR
ncbi:hypothetical protein CDD83_5146 [Cordyceps sp. RAO-2017]|nr:hypothetical protein CDD83_5146 [Cordyceps sp. RAO-2017]